MEQVQIEGITNFILQMMPILLIIGVLADVVHRMMSFGSYGGSSSTSELPEDDINSYDAEKHMRLEIEREIKERFARGEISSAEYTEMMSRL